MPTEDKNLKPHATPRDFFLHLGVIVTLYISSVSLIALLFQIINSAFPDALSSGLYGSYDPYSSAVRLAIASLIIAFPLFWLLSWILNRDYIREPLRKEVWVRRWLVYLTLFIAGVTIMIDLIVLVNTFLGGEISARFFLKVLAVLIVAGLIFGYYIYDLKKYPQGSSKMMKPFLSGAALLILISIVGGFFVMGSPTKQRDIQFDSRRVSDLQMTQSQIVYYWQHKGSLPGNLDALRDPISNFTVPVDPKTGASYDYQPIGPMSFELCADFSQPSSKTNEPMPAIYPGSANDVWTHEAGHQCFERTIDPQLYPPVTPQGQNGSGVGVVPKGATQTNQNPNGPDYFPNGGPGSVPIQE